ncbi:hypothetical protein THRCLA_02876 [Thraustotheca clavata]|uniref:FYVE-type domain-containing protein n=1 Tax=Thraustotheca clavata TaxID=74557 RepID=A0A1W0A4F5_9STRA|nr:hypothetical protein THRCLA_02876 [Thraustotheca clavata]
MTVLWDDRWYPHGDLVHAAVDHLNGVPDAPEAPLDYSWPFPWPRPPILRNEQARLNVLRSLNILDTPPEDAFDAACDFATNGLGCPMAYIGLMDEHREWFKAQVGLSQREIPRNISFTAYAMQSKETMVVLDTLRDKRFYKNPMVTNVAAIRFVAATPIFTRNGIILGAIVVLDTRPHDSFDVSTIERLASVAMTNIEDRKAVVEDVLSPMSPLSPARKPSSNVYSEHTSSHSQASTRSLQDHVAQLNSKEEPVLVITCQELLRREDWAPATVRSSCERCHQPFNILRRRHHCNTCGEVFCSTCLVENMAERPGGFGVQKVNVCSTCLNIATVLGNFKHSRAMRKAVLDILGKPGVDWRHNKRPPSKSGEFTNKLEQIKKLEEKDSIALNRLLNPDQYVPFSSATNCTVCTRKYSMFVHKHHCSVCGDVVCVNCIVKKFLQLPNRQEWPQVTICFSCELGRLTTVDDQSSDLPSYYSGRSQQVVMRGRHHVLAIDQLCPQTKWIPLSERPRCVRCYSSFSVFRHAYHCRMCGEVVCKSCTEKRPVRHRTQDKVTDVPICTSCRASPLLYTNRESSSKAIDESVIQLTNDDNCYVCACTFTLARWKHRCRWCMHDVCSQCRPSQPNKQLGVMEGKVCLKCLLKQSDEINTAKCSKEKKARRPPDSPASTDVYSSNGSSIVSYELDFNWSHPWPKPPVLPDEAERLEALHRCDILDTPPNDVFDILCDLAIKATGCPMAAVAFLDEDRLWFKARMGLAQSQLPRNVAFCSHTIRVNEPMVVLNATLDERFSKNPLVTGRAKIRFYAGSPITTPTGYIIGTVFVLDRKDRDEFDARALKKLSNIAMAHINYNNKKGYMLS